jgi:hypothetical protein
VELVNREGKGMTGGKTEAMAGAEQAKARKVKTPNSEAVAAPWNAIPRTGTTYDLLAHSGDDDACGH